MSADAIPRLDTALEGRYRIERALGEGGMATVHLAEDLKHKRTVALKVLKPELAAVVGPERFLREIQVTANLHHPHTSVSGTTTARSRSWGAPAAPTRSFSRGSAKTPSSTRCVVTLGSSRC